MDETGITNVQRPFKIIATKKQRTVGKVTSGERGTTVTVIYAMSAVGAYLAPMFIYPRKRMIAALLNGAPPQSVGYTSASGWTDSDLFIKWLENFVGFTIASKNNPHIIILDGHHSHKTLSAITFARDNGLHLLTPPPHCTHKKQPLNRTYFKSLKSSYNVAADSWLVSNPEKRITFYDMAGILGTAIHGFKCSGLWPFDPAIFNDDDFGAAVVTEEAQPVTLSVQYVAATAGAGSQSVGLIPPLPVRPTVADVEVVTAGAPPVQTAVVQPVATVSGALPITQLNDETQPVTSTVTVQHDAEIQLAITPLPVCLLVEDVQAVTAGAPPVHNEIRQYTPRVPT